jgi:plastocyanin
MSLFKHQVVAATQLLMLSGFLVTCQATPTLVPVSAAGIGVAITRDSCPSVGVEVKQQVSWTNQDSREHIVRDITDTGNAEFDSGPLQTGDHFEFTFLKVGTYTYECSTDGIMTGTITVEP